MLEFQRSGLSDARIDVTRFSGNELSIVNLVNQLADLFVQEEKGISDAVGSILDGSFHSDIPRLPGSRGIVTDKLTKICENLSLMQTDITRFSDGCIAGDLSARIDPTRYQGGFKEMIESLDSGFNNISVPIRIAAAAFSDFADGKVPDLISADKYSGDIGSILKDINRVIDVSKMRGADITMLISAAVEGKLDARADATKYPGYHGKILEGINKILDAYIGPINVSAEYIDRISKGDLPPRITEAYRGDFNEIKNNLNALIDIVHMRNEDIKMLINSGIDGRLDVRAESKKYPGENGKMIEGINHMLDAYIGPINVSAEYIDRISKGDIPPKITESYRGDFNEIKNNLNNLIDVTNLRNDDIKTLIDAATAGKLDFRADARKYSGENGKMIEGINEMLDAYIGPINVSAEYIDRISKGDLPPKITEDYRGDFNEIKNNLNTLIDVIHLRNDDISLLATAAQEGRLDFRADISKYTGYHGGLIERINKILDSYLGPINVSAEYIDRVSKGDIPPKIADDYRGDFNEIKNNLNALIDIIHMRNTDIKMLIDAAIDGKLDVRADSAKYPGENGKMIDGINHMLDAYIGPINVSAEYIDRISKGDIPPRITEDYHGDFNEIKNNLNALMDVIHMRNADIKALIDAAIDGKLDVRADSSKYPGENGKMIDGINHMLDAYIGPINVSAEYIDRISKGDIPPRITEDYHGDFNEIKNNLNALMDVIHMRNADIKALIDAAIDGKLDVRADSSKYPGENGKMIDGINHMLDAYIGPINVSAEYIDRISKGDIPPRITEDYHGDFNEIKNNLNALMDVIHMRNADITALIDAAIDGKLDVRADSLKYPGENGKMIDGINHMLDAYIGPINVSAEYIDRISKGDIPPRITEDYHGDFNEIKNNLNALMDVIHMRNADIKALIDAAIDGKLDVRADSSKYPGENGKMIDGINHMLDAYIGPINVSAEYIDRISKGDIPPRITEDYHGDFNEIKNNLNALMDVVHMRNKDIEMLIDAALDGKLDVRADSAKYPGENGKMIDGINHMLDAYIGPINVSAEYIDRISKGDIPPKITEDYRGDFNEIKNNLNALIDVIHMRNADIKMLIQAAIDGKLDVRADASKYPGENGKMLLGINQMLDAYITPLNLAAEYIDRISKGDLPPVITDEYRGDFNEIKNNLNQCINAINLLIDDANLLSGAAVKGDLEVRADPLRHQGDFARVVTGMNQTFEEVVNPLREGMRVSDQYSRCNFAEIFDTKVRAEGDFSLFKESLDHIGVEISSTVATLKKEVDNLSHHAATAQFGVEDVSRGAKEISQNAEETSANAAKSEDGIDQVLRAMSDLTVMVSEISGNADSVARLSEDANNLAKKGTEHAENADKGMESITRSSSEVESIITEIRSEMNQIRKIVNIITDLANQTNLLALNAAIEAARAGDAGRGFAVVASEVKSLAQESRTSAESIADMIQGLERKSDNAAIAIEAAGKAVLDGNRALNDTLNVFTQLTDSVDTINQKMVTIARATEQQAASFEEITASANEMSILVKKTADDATHSSATSEEALAVVSQITEIIDLINEAVANMHKEMEVFTLRNA
ncbi:methyl-accepting chemotaxis protein [uncultured Methanospirillum sp.]|uniref:methyl-accepting chemotaxis protein n=1 Tax=uncultured Methanospirillum sp. TaxID=262503 RepID=UPI0037493114